MMEVLMPQLGETVNEGTIANWHKRVGDPVAKDEVLLEVETDKVAIEIPAPADGVLSEIRVEAGETVDVGTVLGVLSGAGKPEAEAGSGASPGVSGGAAESAKPEPVPASGNIAAGAPAAKGENIGADPELGRKSSPRSMEPGLMLSPAVRRLVAEHEVNLAQVKGTGKGGRITRNDVLSFLAAAGEGAKEGAKDGARAGTQASQAAQPELAAAPGKPQASPAEDAGNIPFNRIRKLTADHMVASKATSPHVLQAVEVEYTAVDEVRRQLGPGWKAEKGFSLTYLPFIARAIALAIADFPRMNASVVKESLQIHKPINFAIAVDLNFDGLVAPVIKNCQERKASDLAEDIRAISQKARTGSLAVDDLAGGTYTISNSGPYGTHITAPIINQPQIAIMSTDGIKKRPVVVETDEGDFIAIRPVGILAQSFDHRAIDGAYSAAFLNRVREIIETHDWKSEF